ncbi:NO-inducible flavohemoprotein [Bacillus sp. 2205SS5-2]|uniref:NO-inducible flavohemoprotein n=1 Tax=Bacillus sp. 2205SS5-2 TaxID=3109031 RepID=UPI003003D25A
MTQLQSRTIDIIKSTVPVLEIHGEAITKHFYKIMFKDHPELLNIFNHAHQKQGRQPKALAASVYAAAKYIDNLEAIIPVVKQIAHKHRSLNVKPEHYPIVGKYLLIAIKDVLGDAATDEIMEAWEVAYGLIADVFISVEKDMYEEAENQVGGWKEFKSFIVSKKEKESDVITSFYLKPKDGDKLASFQPGQYISVRVTIPNSEFTHIRQYSLSDSPTKDYYRISVKKEEEINEKPAGMVSNFLHSSINEGDELEITAPAGDFVLLDNVNQPVVLLSGGVGLTPMVSMLNHLIEKKFEKDIFFIHATRNSEFHGMKDELSNIQEQNSNVNYFVCYDSPTEKDKLAKKYDKAGYIEKEWLRRILPTEEAQYYFCGPAVFMKKLYKDLLDLGVNPSNIHYEFFGPAMDIEE